MGLPTARCEPRQVRKEATAAESGCGRPFFFAAVLRRAPLGEQCRGASAHGMRLLRRFGKFPPLERTEPDAKLGREVKDPLVAIELGEHDADETCVRNHLEAAPTW